MNNPILEMRDVSKSFFGCVLSTLPSMGENGAGKSTADEDPIGRL